MKILIIASLVVTVTYLVYRFFLQDETNFKYLRLYLLSSILLAVLMPFNSYKININLIPENRIIQDELIPSKYKQSNTATPSQSEFASTLSESDVRFHNSYNWQTIIKMVYFIVAGFFLAKTFIQILFLMLKIFTADKIRKEKYVLIYNHGFKNSFSFFHWIFIDHTNESQKDSEKIIAHELVHAEQYHSLDLIFIELLAALMWFNPFVWMMRHSLQLVHEYLADEGVIKKGADRLNYQELLINQAAEEKLISISSSFNKSLIKKRIIMMNHEKITRKMGYKILVLFPVATVLFLVVSCMNGQNEQSDSTNKELDSKNNKSTVTAVAPTKMNVLYVGVENPVNVAVSGYESTQIEIELKDNEGRIEGANGNYVIMPSRPGLLTVVVKADGNVVQETRFRAKSIPRPVIYVSGKVGGEITKEDLLKQKEVNVFMENFDFDVSFRVISFTISTTNSEGYHISVESESNKITEEQKQLIERSNPGQRIDFESVKAIGPDGSTRNIAPTVFEIVE